MVNYIIVSQILFRSNKILFFLLLSIKNKYQQNKIIHLYSIHLTINGMIIQFKLVEKSLMKINNLNKTKVLDVIKNLYGIIKVLHFIYGNDNKLKYINFNCIQVLHVLKLDKLKPVHFTSNLKINI